MLHTFYLATFTALVHLIAPTLAIPVVPLLIAPRTQRCDNAPNTVAGTMFNRRARLPADLKLRTSKSVLWCASGSSTYVLLTPAIAIAGDAVENLLDAATGHLIHLVDAIGDKAVPDGVFNWPTNSGLVLKAWNANNHQLTYGVLGAALDAVGDYMSFNGFCHATFAVYDGVNQVGEGVVG